MSIGTTYDKSKKFAIRIIKLYDFLCEEKKEFIMSKQVLHCGTSVGANVREANVAISKAEFVAKMNIALNEAAEAEYWLELLCDSEYISKSQFESIYIDCNELNKLLTAIIKSSKEND